MSAKTEKPIVLHQLAAGRHFNKCKNFGGSLAMRV